MFNARFLADVPCTTISMSRYTRVAALTNQALKLHHNDLGKAKLDPVEIDIVLSGTH